jgi:hypothetical protein
VDFTTLPSGTKNLVANAVSTVVKAHQDGLGLASGDAEDVFTEIQSESGDQTKVQFFVTVRVDGPFNESIVTTLDSVLSN